MSYCTLQIYLTELFKKFNYYMQAKINFLIYILELKTDIKIQSKNN
ncbi:hypothetical protein MPUT_0179 [Mycoplasma putrefaciens KS1]|uniref:Uncharacterized protein n=1 Tax=Mycoplasma putrefaciens (strain ATCC 15718 / NCTC 10155 / C30 KS-1 / KS-1) TaxID=743965 RepID=A0A7U4E9E5_MYCPK|nr:hypothetical protein MPUT_0179 [Mycoplasma putrefaciens KS1]